MAALNTQHQPPSLSLYDLDPSCPFYVDQFPPSISRPYHILDADILGRRSKAWPSLVQRAMALVIICKAHIANASEVELWGRGPDSDSQQDVESQKE